MKNNFIEKNMIIILFLTLFSAMVYSETKFRVSGKVVNHGKGLVGIRIRFFNKTKIKVYYTNTDEYGKFDIYLPKGRYKMVVNKQKKYFTKIHAPIY